ncbi:MAG TPA: hypothetical protein DC054_18005 [Blastocatellia bacterium]|nr:hypothetical protein [Blastocatellia bacterium]
MRYALEQNVGETDSVRQARGAFMALIPDLAPSVTTQFGSVKTIPSLIAGLWRVFFVFILTVAERFRADLLNAPKGVRTGEEVFQRLLDEVYQEQESAFWINKDRGDILTIALHRFHRLEQSKIERAFPDWKSLASRKSGRQLHRRLEDWSRTSGLDADWCRDHAVRFLVPLLFDGQLPWTFLFPDSDPLSVTPYRGSRLIDIWRFTARHVTADVAWSRFDLAVQVYGNQDLEPFVFRWSDLSANLRELHDDLRDFEAPYWNYLRETSAEYKRRVEIDFRIYCLQREITRLRNVREQEDWRQKFELKNQLAGALTSFKTKLNDYMANMTTKKKTAEAKHSLHSVDEKRSLAHHLEWTVRVQIYGEKVSDIAKSANVKDPAVSKAVGETLRLIGLKKRAAVRRGRVRGSKNKLSPTAAILRGLGR